MAWRTWRKPFDDGRMNIARISLSLLSIVAPGCASTSQMNNESASLTRMTPEATPAALTKETQWDVTVNSVMPLRYEFSFGPFSTSIVNTGMFAGSENREPKPTGETAQFLGNKVAMSFEVSHSSGGKVKVRAADEADGSGYQLGRFVLKESQSKTGSICVDGNVIGQFFIRKQSSLNQVPVSELRQGVQAGTVTTSIGEIQVSHRFEPPPGAETKLGQFFGLPDVPNEEYRLDGKIIAARRGVVDAAIWIDRSLPVDAQLCIASAMTVPMAQQAINDGAARATSLSSSMMRLGR